MRTKQYNVYKFNELSKEAQEQAIYNLQDINVAHNWWSYIYGMFQQCGIKIKSFDIYRYQIEIEFIEDIEDVFSKLIKDFALYPAEHIASRYQLMIERKKQEALNNEGVDPSDFSVECEETYDDICDSFKHKIKNEIFDTLKKDYDYLTSEKSIVETIELNDYDFLDNGELDPFPTS